MNPRTLALAFSPLVLFSVVGHLLGPPMVGWAALASAVLALVILIAGRRDGVRLVTLASMIIFGGLAALALLGGPTGRWFVDVFGSGVCALLIGLAMLISVVTVPFTEPYARAAVPRRAWGTPEFKVINKQLSLVWAGVVIGIGLSRLAYASISVASGDQVGTLLRLGLSWGVPVLLVVAGLRRTQQLAGSDDHDATSGDAAAARGSGPAPRPRERQP